MVFSGKWSSLSEPILRKVKSFTTTDKSYSGSQSVATKGQNHLIYIC